MSTSGRIFFDVDTQNDFLFPGGALYVPGAEAIVDKVAALNRFAAAHGIPVVSTTDAHTPDDPEFKEWPPHCIAGTPGQHKPESTLLEGRITVSSREEPMKIDAAPQVVLEKQMLDCFSNPNLPALLDRLQASDCIVYGLVTEICVKLAAFGLLRRGCKVSIVTDAVKELDPDGAAKMFGEFTAAGGSLTMSAAIFRAG